MSLIYGGSYPWTSPELLDFEACEHKPTKESDIYALGMLIYEVRTHGLLRRAQGKYSKEDEIGLVWERSILRSHEFGYDCGGDLERDASEEAR